MIYLKRTSAVIAVVWFAVMLTGCPSRDTGELVEQARTQLGAARFDQAITSLTRAVRIDSSLFDAWFLRGKAHGERGFAREDGQDFGRAIEDFSRALMLSPNSAEAFYFRGSAFNAVSRSEEALRDLGLAIQLKPGYVEALRTRGMAYAGLGLYDSALVDLDQALAQNPGDPNVHMLKGLVYEETGRTDDALVAYESYISLVEADASMAGEVAAVEQRIRDIESGVTFKVLTDPEGGPGQ